jgi:hypothetical protein
MRQWNVDLGLRGESGLDYRMKGLRSGIGEPEAGRVCTAAFRSSFMVARSSLHEAQSSKS